MKISKNRLKEIIIEEISALEELTPAGVPTPEPEELDVSKSAARKREAGAGTATVRSREIGGMTPREAKIVAIMQELRGLLAKDGELPGATAIARYVNAALTQAQKQGGRG